MATNRRTSRSWTATSSGPIFGLKCLKGMVFPLPMWRARITSQRAISIKKLLLTCSISFAILGVCVSSPLHAFGAIGGGDEAAAFDALLVLATDVSGSITEEKYEIQRKGITTALINPRVIEAILNGRHKKVVIAYVEWEGLHAQKVQVPWTTITSLDDAIVFANQISKVERLNFISKADRQLYRNEISLVHSDNTSIYGAITFCQNLIQRADFSADLKILDISSDGENNEGPEPDLARDMAIAGGISINGLVIIGDDFPELETYFQAHVVGGNSSFTMHIEGIEGVAAGLSAKLIKEIASRTIGPVIHSASFDGMGFE